MTTHAYDGADNRIPAVRPGPAEWAFGFDPDGRLIEEDDRYGQRSHWTHDEVGNRLQLRDPAGTTDTAPDRLNRISRLSTAAGSSTLGYTPAGRIDRLQHPNGARSDHAYDRAGRIERIVHRQGGSEVARFEYAHDARGNRREERRIDASRTQLTTYTYTYDDDDRLTGTTATAADGSVTETVYTLDAVCNSGGCARRKTATKGATREAEAGGEGALECSGSTPGAPSWQRHSSRKRTS